MSNTNRQHLLLYIMQQFRSAWLDALPAVLRAIAEALSAQTAQLSVWDSNRSADYMPILHQTGYVVAIPLEEVRQMLHLYYDAQAPQMSDEDRQFLQVLGAVLGQSLRGIRALAVAQHFRYPVFLLDDAKLILEMNPKAEAVLGKRAEECAGRSLLELIPNPDFAAYIDNPRPIEDKNRFFLRFADQTYQPFVNAIPGVGKLIMLTDVSHFKRLNENMTLFLQTVSHDLRSPLTAAKGFLDMLSMVGELNEKQTSMREKVLTSIVDMTNLVEKVLDAGRLDPEMGAYQLRRDMCDPALVVEKVVSNLMPAAHKKNIRLYGHVGQGVPMMNLDEMMIERALMNLVENAIKYTPEEGEVSVEVVVEDNQLKLSVRDNGLGIPPENQLTLFDRGSRVRRTEHKAIRGSGLGLFIVKNVAQQHGGDVQLTSGDGQGSEFNIVLPIVGQNTIGAGSG